MTRGEPTTYQGANDATGVGRLAVLCGLLIAVAALAVSVRSLGFALVRFDDDINITFNPHLGPLTSRNLSWILTDADYVRRYIPVGWLTLSAVYSLCGLSAVGYHAAAILFHAGASVLVFMALLLFVGEASGKPRDRWQVTVSFLGAAVWSLHPFRVETTGWASGLLYSESGFFALLALVLYLAAGRGRRSGGLVGLSAFAYLISLLAYPMSLGWSAVFVLVEVWRQGGSLRTVVPAARRVAIMLLPALLVAGVTVAAGYHARDIWPAPPSLAQFPLPARATQAAYVWIYYLWRMLWPVGLTPEPTELISFDPAGWPFVASAVAWAAITAALSVQKASRGALLLWLAYLAVLAPMVGLTVTPHYPNDRYAYLPSVVVSAALCVLAAGVVGPGARRAWSLLGLAIACVVGVLSLRQAAIWRSTDTVYRRLAEGAGYVPAKVHVLCRWALRDAMVGRLDDAAALLAAGERAFPGFPEFAGERRRIADMLAGSRARHPGSPTASIESNLHLDFALDANREGRWAEARSHFEQALVASPDSTDARFDFAVFEAFQGNPRAALHQYYALDPGSEPAAVRARLLGLIADAFARAGESAAARSAYARALQLVGTADPSLRASLEARQRPS